MRLFYVQCVNNTIHRVPFEKNNKIPPKGCLRTICNDDGDDDDDDHNHFQHDLQSFTKIKKQQILNQLNY